MAEQQKLQHVPNRSCGFCTVCCYAPLIDSPELKKAPGIVCPNCDGRSCRIYEARPQICRAFECGWRLWPNLGDEWRPDRSGLLILPHSGQNPPKFEGRQGWDLLALGGEPTVGSPAFADLVLQLARDQIPIYLAAAGPPGHTGAIEFLNPHLATSAKNDDRKETTEVLLGLLKMLENQVFEPVQLET